MFVVSTTWRTWARATKVPPTWKRPHPNLRVAPHRSSLNRVAAAASVVALASFACQNEHGVQPRPPWPVRGPSAVRETRRDSGAPARRLGDSRTRRPRACRRRRSPRRARRAYDEVTADASPLRSTRLPQKCMMRARELAMEQPLVHVPERRRYRRRAEPAGPGITRASRNMRRRGVPETASAAMDTTTLMMVTSCPPSDGILARRSGGHPHTRAVAWSAAGRRPNSASALIAVMSTYAIAMKTGSSTSPTCRKAWTLPVSGASRRPVDRPSRPGTTAFPRRGRPHNRGADHPRTWRLELAVLVQSVVAASWVSVRPCVSSTIMTT